MTLSEWDKQVLANMECPNCKAKKFTMVEAFITWFICGNCQSTFYNNGWDLTEMRSTKQRKEIDKS